MGGFDGSSVGKEWQCLEPFRAMALALGKIIDQVNEVARAGALEASFVHLIGSHPCHLDG